MFVFKQEDVLFTMVGWYKQEIKLPEKEIPDVNYVLDVWIPEVRNYSALCQNNLCTRNILYWMEAII